MPPPVSTVAGASCNKCPSFLGMHQQNELVGSNINGPMCGKKMLPLLMPAQSKDSQTRLLGHTAKMCSMYGDQFEGQKLPDQAVPDMPVGMDTNWTKPMPTDTQRMARCYSCANFIPEDAVYSKTGWTGGICRASGNLMATNRITQYSAKCGSYVRQAGPRANNPFATFTLFPGFSDSFGRVDPAASYKAYLNNFTDPRNWINERWTGTLADGSPELSPARQAKMKEHNIRAYRRIIDPDGYGQEVFLPVYDYDAWPDELKSLVPLTGDDEHPELYADHGQLLYTMAVLWLKLDETPALWGQPGTGKTEFLRHLAWMMCAPFTRISISGSSEVDDIIGKMMFVGNPPETRFHYGRLTTAWENPGVLLLDEPNTGQPEIWQILRPLTDNSRTLVVDQATAKSAKRHADCYFGMAMNPAWDPRNVGTQTIGDADGSRLMHLFFDYPPRELEMEIIQRRCGLDGFTVQSSQMDALMKVTEELRRMSADQEIHVTWGVRNTIKVARALAWFLPLKAFRHAVTDSLEPAQMELVMSVVKSQFGE